MENVPDPGPVIIVCCARRQSKKCHEQGSNLMILGKAEKEIEYVKLVECEQPILVLVFLFLANSEVSGFYCQVPRSLTCILIVGRFDVIVVMQSECSGSKAEKRGKVSNLLWERQSSYNWQLHEYVCVLLRRISKNHWSSIKL